MFLITQKLSCLWVHSLQRLQDSSSRKVSAMDSWKPGILTFIIPSVLLGHLTGLMTDEVKVPLLGLWMALFVIFAGRKFSQPIKDDIGDKSVFMFNTLPEDQKNALVEKLRAEKVYSEP